MAKKTVHYFELAFPKQRIVITYHGQKIAETKDAVLLKERKGTMFNPIYYIPRQDIEMDMLIPMEKKSFCVIKGHTTKFSLKIEGDLLEHATWSYTEPSAEAEEIRDLMAFDLRIFSMELHPF